MISGFVSERAGDIARVNERRPVALSKRRDANGGIGLGKVIHAF